MNTTIMNNVGRGQGAHGLEKAAEISTVMSRKESLMLTAREVSSLI